MNYLPSRPVRAAQYRAGEKMILGRRVETIHGATSFEPHGKGDELVDGDWVVESTDRRRLEVIPEARFVREYRPVRSWEEQVLREVGEGSHG